MNSYFLFEISIVCVIVYHQFRQFLSIKEKIEIFKKVIPHVNNFSIKNAKLNANILTNRPETILENIDIHISESKPKLISQAIYDENGSILRKAIFKQDDRVIVDLIECNRSYSSYETRNIIQAINKYLLRNRGVASDFNLMKDIVDRNTDALESEIMNSISLPLYFGLLGTFSGIVIGLFQIYGTNLNGDNNELDAAINSLLFGVMIAMVASAVGLFLTMLNTGYNFKNAKVEIEKNKNEFYSFLQIELLPVLNQSINYTLLSLQNNLFKFNDEFKIHINSLSTILGKNHDALVVQENILTSLENIDITKFAKANVTILKELQTSMENLHEFGHYIHSLNYFITSSEELTSKINDLFDKTDNFGKLAESIHATFQENQKLTEFLQNHYNALDDSHQLITKSVFAVNLTLDESLDQLKNFTQERINELQKITLRELDLLQNEYPEKWKKLDNLSYLESLSKDIKEIKSDNNLKGLDIISSLNVIKENNQKQIHSLELFLEKTGVSFFSKMYEKIKNFPN